MDDGIFALQFYIHPNAEFAKLGVRIIPSDEVELRESISALEVRLMCYTAFNRHTAETKRGCYVP